MVSLRTSVVNTSTLLKAATFRLNTAQTQVTQLGVAFTSALSDVKAGNVPNAKETADKAGVALQEAKTALATAESEVADRQLESEAAKAQYNEHHASRLRRKNARTFEPVRVPTQTPATRNGFSELGDEFAITAYLATAKTAVADPSTMTAFPNPPSAPCKNLSCAVSKPTRTLDACLCNIKQVFSNLGGEALKAAKANFHPDRFGSADVAKTDGEAQAKAQEIHTVLVAMIQQAKPDQKKLSSNGKIFQQTAKRTPKNMGKF